jgi:hypothetical protein
MSPIAAAISTLDQTRSVIGEDAYAVIRAGLEAADELRAAPGRDATASALVRSREEFRRQPHLAGVEIRPVDRPAAPAAPTRTPAAPSRKPAAPARPEQRPVRGMTLGH